MSMMTIQRVPSYNYQTYSRIRCECVELHRETVIDKNNKKNSFVWLWVGFRHSYMCSNTTINRTNSNGRWRMINGFLERMQDNEQIDGKHGTLGIHIAWMHLIMMMTLTTQTKPNLFSTTFWCNRIVFLSFLFLPAVLVMAQHLSSLHLSGDRERKPYLFIFNLIFRLFNCFSVVIINFGFIFAVFSFFTTSTFRSNF